jgi:predicted 3-demethylubiquinone-9 3-methyltransferase (glyoxalase superfamily)
MKRSFQFIVVIVAVGLIFSTTQALAAPVSVRQTPNSQVGKKPQANPNEQGEKKGKVQHFKGTVTGKSASSLTLKLKVGSSVTFVIDDKTQIKIPTVKHATVDQINPGVQANVQAVSNSTGALVALKVQVVPGKPILFRRVGVVTAYTAGSSITIQDKAGNTTTFLLTPDTKITPRHLANSLAPGVTVTIISRRDPAGGALAAQGIVIHKESAKHSGK